MIGYHHISYNCTLLETMKKKNILAQYYTPEDVADRVVTKALEMGLKPKTVLELAAGEGHLLIALTQNVDNCNVYAVDIDSTNTKLIKNSHPNWNVYNKDATSSLSFLDGIEFDLALGNPPFLKTIIVDKYIRELLFKTLGITLKIGSKTRAEIVFICQYINKLNINGILAIILPDSIASGYRMEKFREAIINKYNIIDVVEISKPSFKSTEAKTHVLYLKKSKLVNNNKIKITSNFSSELFFYIDKFDAIKRLDYSYYNNKETRSDIRLGDIAKISRGKNTHKSLKSTYSNYIHSTTFNSNFTNDETYENENEILISGDVIMCRVGTRVVGKTREYNGYPVPYSDCIYRIRFYDNDKKSLFLKYLKSEQGQRHINSISRGVCSRYITKFDLENLIF